MLTYNRISPIQIRPVLSTIDPGGHSHSYDPTVLTHSPLKQASGPISLHSSTSSHIWFDGFRCVPEGQIHCKQTDSHEKH